MRRSRPPEFSVKDIKDLLEECGPLLEEAEIEEARQWLRISKLFRSSEIRYSLGIYLSLRLLHQGEGVPPYKYMAGTPSIPLAFHSLTVGQPGVGKTVFANIQVVRMALSSEATIIVIDTEGDRAPFIVTELERAGAHDRWLYFDASIIRENIYELAGIDPIWFDRLARVFTELGTYGDIGLGNLREIFMDVNAAAEYQRMGGWATLDETLQFMRERASRTKGRKAQYLEVAAERFQFWVPAIAPIFRYRSGYPWKALKGKVIIYDLRGLTLDGQLFFQNFLMQKIMFIQERTDLTDDPSMRDYVHSDIDELHKFTASAKQKLSQYPPIMLEVGRTSRKRKKSIGYKDQFMSTVEKELVGTCAALVIFRLRDQDCLKKCQRELNLTTDQAAYIAKLDDRQCIFIGKGMKEPVLAEIEEVDLSGLLTHQEIKELMHRKLENFAYEPPEQPAAREPGSEKASPGLQDLLMAIARMPGNPLHEIRRELRLRKAEFDRLVALAVDRELVSKPEPISLGKPGNPPLYCEILPAAAEVVGRSFEEIRFPGGKTKSLRGKMMTLKLVEALRRDGHKVRTEHFGADVVGIKDGVLTCYEVESSPMPAHQIALNIRRDLRGDLNPGEVVVVMERQDELEAVEDKCRTRLHESEMARVRFRKITEFLEEDRKCVITNI
jgi:hypothetical protein